ncbi:MAG: autotransporter domain-containing protein [Verrucomicrobiota bacterium]
MNKYLSLLLSLFFVLEITGLASPGSSESEQISSDISDEDKRNSGVFSNASSANPDSPFNNQFETVESNVQTRFSNQQGISAATSIYEADSPAEALKDDSWFRNPAVYADYTYATSNDSRAFGLDADQHDVTFGIDFETVYGLVVGMLVTYSNMDGEADDIPGLKINTDNETVLLSWYISKQITDWLFTGATLSYSLSDLDQRGGGLAAADFDIDTIGASYFIGAAKNWDRFGVSSTVSYSYVDATWDPVNQVGVTNDFNQSSGTFAWRTTGTWFVTDWFDVAVTYKMSQIVHENFATVAPAGTNSDDNHWGDVSIKGTVYPNQNLSLFTGVEYTVFNDNYEESISVNSGVVYNF